MNGHTIICGIGRMGSILARDLHKAGKSFVVIDADERKLKVGEELGYSTILGDATDEFVLEQAGIQRAEVLATVLSDDATNVFVTITAREMNPSLIIIARGENPRTEKKLLGCGANRVVLPTAIGANKVAQLIIRPTAENLMDHLSTLGNMKHELEQLGIQFEELKISPDSDLVNRKLSDVKLTTQKGFLIVGIQRAEGSTLMDINKDTQLLAGDKLVVLINTDDALNFSSRLSLSKSKILYRGVESPVN